MVGTFNKIDYRLRPAKHAERLMLIDLFKRMRFEATEAYQYIGLGSVAFVDFRMIHRLLGITKMTSIEDTNDPDEQRRFENNKPYNNLRLVFGNSSAILPTLDFNAPSLVWMDYDGLASKSMANDLTGIAKDIPSGSFLAFTFTNSFPISGNGRDTYFNKLKEQFPNYLKESDKASILDGKKYSKWVRNTFNSLIQKALKDADSGKAVKEKRVAKQVCYFKYKDGIEMATIGWVIVAKYDEPDFLKCQFDGLPFAKFGDEAFRIEVPLITPLEVREMERLLPDIPDNSELDWIPIEQQKSFFDAYRYLPNFAPVEAI